MRVAVLRHSTVIPTRTTGAPGFWFDGLFAILVAIGAARAFDVVAECLTTPARLAFIPVTEV